MMPAQSGLSIFIDAMVAVGTISSVVVALFGNVLRAKFKPPRLVVSLVTSAGEKNILADTSTGAKVDDVRYYHLRVENENRRWTTAANVGLFLIRIEEPGADEQLITKWAGEVPIRCRHQEIYALQREIGSPIDYDFCSVTKSRRLHLHPIIIPTNMKVVRSGRCVFVATLQAKATQADSPMIRVKVSWDGLWDDGETEMKDRIKVALL